EEEEVEKVAHSSSVSDRLESHPPLDMFDLSAPYFARPEDSSLALLSSVISFALPKSKILTNVEQGKERMYWCAMLLDREKVKKVGAMLRIVMKSMKDDEEESFEDEDDKKKGKRRTPEKKKVMKKKKKETKVLKEKDKPKKKKVKKTKEKSDSLMELTEKQKLMREIVQEKKRRKKEKWVGNKGMGKKKGRKVKK
ncbi:BCP1 family like protein, partial [Aduncisulcus paluster]